MILISVKLSKFLKKNYTKIYSDLDIFYSFYKNDCITITVLMGNLQLANLLYEILLNQKFDVRLVGNIGNPLLMNNYIKAKFKLIKNQSDKDFSFSKKNDNLI